MGGLWGRPAFWLVMGRGCSKSTFEEYVVRCSATLHYRLLFSPLQKNEITLSILVLCLHACKLPPQNESSMFRATRRSPFPESKGRKKNMKTMKYALNGQSCRTCSCCGAILLSWALGEGVHKVKWDRTPWQSGGNSMRGFAAPGTHLFLRRVPADTVSRWHTVKLDCGKHHHAETDKGKNKRCFYFQILVVPAEEGRNCCLNNNFVFYVYVQSLCRFMFVKVQKLHLMFSSSSIFLLKTIDLVALAHASVV